MAEIPTLTTAKAMGTMPQSHKKSVGRMEENFKPLDFGPVEDMSQNIIKVIGVGGGGCNAVRNMLSEGIEGVTYAVCNTDSASLAKSPVPVRIQLGAGLGAGANPEVGRMEAESNIADIYNKVARSMDPQKIRESVSHLTNPLDNAINEKCSRIKNAFLKLMDEYTASYYIISGHTQRRLASSSRVWYQRLKIITLPRELVIMESPLFE